MTVGALVLAMPGLGPEKARLYLPHLEKAMAEAKITTRRRAAAFLAQLGHESVSLRYMEEIASGAAYEGRRDLGNVHPGDGRRYKGRGPIQLTGRANYRAAGKALGLTLEANPHLAATPAVGFRVACWYWKTRGLNALADRGDFNAITRRVNGGYNGKADRDARYRRCLALGAAILPTSDKLKGLTSDERAIAKKRIHHEREIRARRKVARNRVWSRYWRTRIQAQMRRLRRDAQKRGWGKGLSSRGHRYQVLKAVVEGRIR